MIDKEYEQDNENYLEINDGQLGFLDFSRSPAGYVSGEQFMREFSNYSVYFKEDLEKAFQAGFDFEEGNFDKWFNKNYKNGG